MYKYRLVSLDIDDTILSEGGQRVSERFRLVARELEDRGVRVCLNTGRNAAYAMPAARSFGARSLCAALEGLSVFDPVTGDVVYANMLDYEYLCRILEAAERAGVFAETTDSLKYRRYSAQNPEFDYDAGQKRQGFVEYCSSYGDLAEKSRGALCVTLGGEPAKLGGALARIAENCRGLLFRKHLWKDYAVISAKTCSLTGKAFGLEWLCERYGVSMRQTVAVGDFLNDAGMIAHAGLGVAMGNGHKLVKALAARTTDTADNDGAAKALEKIFRLR